MSHRNNAPFRSRSLASCRARSLAYALKFLPLSLAVISLGPFPPPSSTASASEIVLASLFLGEPDVFVPGFDLEAEISLTRSLGVWASGAYFLSGTWDLETGLRWHLSPQFALSLQALFLFDVVDGFVPQLGAGARWSFPLTPTGCGRSSTRSGSTCPLWNASCSPSTVWGSPCVLTGSGPFRSLLAHFHEPWEGNCPPASSTDTERRRHICADRV